MVDPNDQIDENRDNNDLTNYDLISGLDTHLSSSRLGSSNDEKRKISSGNEFFSETKIVYGTTAIMEVSNEVLTNCRSNYDVYCDRNGPAFMIAISPYREEYAKLKRNNVNIRLITEVTADNLRYCKEIINILSAEVKHLEGVKGNFVISDKKIYLGTTNLEENKHIPDLVYSNAKGIIEQNRFMFETLWKRALPAEQRIRQIEKGILPVETYLIDDPVDAFTYTVNLVNGVEEELSNCTSICFLKLAEQSKPFLDAYANLLLKLGKGKFQNKRVRWITCIENNMENIDLISRFLDLGIKIRHTNRLPSLNFFISEKQFASTVEKINDEGMFENLLHSTESLYMNHFRLLFEELWNNGLDAETRIRQIKTGIIPETTQIIEDSDASRKLLLQLIENAKDEILIIYPTSKAVDLQKKIGTLDIILKKSQQGLKIRIISPKNMNLNKLILPPHFESGPLISEYIIIREILEQQDFKPTIVMVDRKHVLILELKDDVSTNFEEATGLTTYSISSPTVLSYISIFDSFWEQTEMSIRLGLANEKLIQNEEMEREFINTAAHELRTPTQAIMGYTELDEELLDDILKTTELSRDEELKRNIFQLRKHFDAVSRNASRLDQLISNLLDVARIESNRINSLQLHKEKLDLVKEINECLKTQLDQKLKTKNVKVNFINHILDDQQCWVKADNARLNQILSNLIENAIKFSPQNGIIDIIIKENDQDRKLENAIESDKSKGNSVKSEVLVGISDRGRGISPKVMPKLFEKFVTGSDTGTGLGLFITKNLVEAHGGKIWAFNNKDGIGSTFVFSLPKVENTIVDKY